MGDDLDWNNTQKHGEQIVMQNYLHGEDKGVTEETIFLIFRWNIILKIHTRQMKLWQKLRNGNKKLLSALETSVVSLKTVLNES